MILYVYTVLHVAWGRYCTPKKDHTGILRYWVSANALCKVRPQFRKTAILPIFVPRLRRLRSTRTKLDRKSVAIPVLGEQWKWSSSSLQDWNCPLEFGWVSRVDIKNEQLGGADEETSLPIQTLLVQTNHLAHNSATPLTNPAITLFSSQIHGKWTTEELLINLRSTRWQAKIIEARSFTKFGAKLMHLSSLLKTSQWDWESEEGRAPLWITYAYLWILWHFQLLYPSSKMHSYRNFTQKNQDSKQLCTHEGLKLICFCDYTITIWILLIVSIWTQRSIIKRRNWLTVLGQTSHLNWLIQSAKNQPATRVMKSPPKNPSHVFLGESLINGVLPSEIPAWSIIQFTGLNLLNLLLMLTYMQISKDFNWLVSLPRKMFQEEESTCISKIYLALKSWFKRPRLRDKKTRLATKSINWEIYTPMTYWYKLLVNFTSICRQHGNLSTSARACKNICNHQCRKLKIRIRPM